MSINKETEISKLSNYFNSLWKDFIPIYKLYQTQHAFYLYDTGTNKIMGCDELEHSFLQLVQDSSLSNLGSVFDEMLLKCAEEQLIRALKKIRQFIEKENILKTKKTAKFGRSSHYKNYDNLINNALWAITLEVTEKCNLRCGYCIYNPTFKNKRNHGSNDMSLNVGRSAIDYLCLHSAERKDVSIGYYGGEPLLRMQFIESCTKYAQDKIKDKSIMFNITTNGTLITKRIARFLFNNNFLVVVSLDGPREVHDSYRKDIYGNGSFEKVLFGIQRLQEAYEDLFQDRVSLSMVYAPPFSEEKINRVCELWDEYPWLPKNFLTISYPRPYSISDMCLNKGKKDLRQWAMEKYREKYLSKEKAHPVVNSIIEPWLARLAKRYVFQKPVEDYHLNGCCIPATRKLYVETNGTFSLCERINKAPSIGDVNSGVNLETIKEIYIDDYSNKSIAICSDCWAIQLCDICYQFAYLNNNFDREFKYLWCMKAKQRYESYLKFYCELLEKDPDGLDHLENMVFS